MHRRVRPSDLRSEKDITSFEYEKLKYVSGNTVSICSNDSVTKISRKIKECH